MATSIIEISFLGYQTIVRDTENVDVKKNTPLDLGVIGLQTTQNLLNEVVVNTHRAAVQNKIDRQLYIQPVSFQLLRVAREWISSETCLR